MKKKVIFIGGVNCCGKSFLTGKLEEEYGYVIGKQKRALIAIGQRRGMPWEEIPSHYDELIVEAAAELADTLRKSDSSVMLIDCHYAFKMKKALAMNLEKKAIEDDEPYIQAIDDRLIASMVKEFDVYFVFVEVDPSIALQRTRQREKNIGDQVATVDSIAEYQCAELDFFHRILEKFDAADRSMVLSNNGDVRDVIEAIVKFVD